MNILPPETVFNQFESSRKGLPTWTYNSPELTALETQQIFLKSWMWAGHIFEVANAGDYQCFEIGSERAIIIRGEDNQIRAFHNVCLHRASRLVPDDSGHCKNALVCPFHGWPYHFDGRLKNVPRPDSLPTLDTSSAGLTPIACEVWHGLIFINFGRPDQSVAELLADANDEVGLYKVSDMQAIESSWRFDFDLDWKSLVDIDGEGYHVPKGHPELHDLVGSSYVDEALESGLSRSRSHIDAGKHRTPLVAEYINILPTESYLPATHSRQWIYWGAFPGFVITLFPDKVEVYQIYPTGYQKSVMAGRCFALPDDRPAMQKARDVNRQLNTIVGQEDVQLIEWAAAGMRSTAYQQSIMSNLEVGVAGFQNTLRNRLPVTTLESEPTQSLAQINNEMKSAQRINAA